LARTYILLDIYRGYNQEMSEILLKALTEVLSLLRDIGDDLSQEK
jgi:hypothetical protein